MGTIICVALALGLVGVAPNVATAAGCANEALRLAQHSDYLADCRALEIVTPPDKDSGEPKAVLVGMFDHGLESVAGAHAGTDGDRMAWISEYPLPGSQAPGLSYLSARTEAGWSSQNVVPPQSPFTGLLCPLLIGMQAYSSDLSKGVLADGINQLPFGREGIGFLEEGSKGCPHDEPRLVPGEPEGYQNLLLRDNDASSYKLINVTPPDVVQPRPHLVGGGPGSIVAKERYNPASFLAGSDDLNHIVFEEELALTPNAPLGFPGGDELYEWSDGVVRLVSVLPGPGEVAVANALLAGTEPELLLDERQGVRANLAAARHAVSADGSRIFFEAEGNLYLREGGVRTVQVDAGEGPGPGGGGSFMLASADGSLVYFTDDAAAGLTADTVPGSGTNLYRYDVESESLTDLTAAGEAGVLGVSGAGEDGGDVYFVATGALAGGRNPRGDVATPGAPNLYAYHEGALSFIANLDPVGDACDWTASSFPKCDGSAAHPILTARVSANGRFLAFNSVRSLTGFDNTDALTGAADREIFLYDVGAGTMTCVSCNPAGASPSAGGAAIHYAAFPGTSLSWTSLYPQLNVSEGGQVFFETDEPLSPHDRNEQGDVYEYEDGALRLISTGASGASSRFLDGTPDGSNVFFATAQPLLAADTDSAYDYYDARVGGGFPERPASPACDGEGCRRPAGAPPNQPVAGSANFVGPPGRRSCAVIAGRAERLGKRAARLRHRAHRTTGRSSARRLHRKARALARQAAGLHDRARRCRRGTAGTAPQHHKAKTTRRRDHHHPNRSRTRQRRLPNA